MSSAVAVDRRSSAWPPLLAALAFVALFHPILLQRGRFFLEEPRFSHGLLVPIVSALWIVDRQDSLTGVTRRASVAGLWFVAAMVALDVYGRLLDAKVGTLGSYVQHVAVIGALVGVVWAAWGARLVRALAIPFGYLAFTFPVPQRLDLAVTLPLQRAASEAATAIFDAMGWTVVREGNVVSLPGVTLLVEEQCSGVHALYALVALGVAWIAFVRRPRWIAATLVVATVPIAVLANVVRVVLTGVIAYKVDPSHAEGVSHEIAGLVVFVIGLATFLLLDWALRPDATPGAQEAESS